MFPVGAVASAGLVLTWSFMTFYFTFWDEHEYFEKKVFDEVHEKFDSKMLLFL